MKACVRMCLLALLALPIGAAEWTVELPCQSGEQRSVPVPKEAFAGVGGLMVSWNRDGAADLGACWLEVVIEATDGRWVTLASPVGVGGTTTGRRHIPLAPEAWAGDHGRLGGDLLASVTNLRLCLHGASSPGVLRLTVATVAEQRAVDITVEQEGDGLVQRIDDEGRPVWREWRIRLAGDLRGELGTLDLIEGDRVLPLFLEQPALVVEGRWMPRGPARWVLRLGDEPLPVDARLHWRSGTADWTSRPLSVPERGVGEEPLPAVPVCALPIPIARSWTGRPVVREGDRWLRRPAITLPESLAPMLRWRSEWTGFRGMAAIAHPQAMAFDRALVARPDSIDLLPRCLAEEQGAFRFGLVPWSFADGGPWRYPQDCFADPGVWSLWHDHAREVMARARATPGLKAWRFGLDVPAAGTAQLACLDGLARDLSALAAADGRPLLVCHPQLVSFGYDQGPDLWADFEQDRNPTDGWTGLELPGATGLRRATEGSQGAHSLVVPLVTGGGVRFGGLQRLIDGNVANLDRLEFDVSCPGPEGAVVQLYAWVTDRHHRWYQQPLMRVPCSPRWSTVTIDLDGGAEWEPVGHSEAWDGDQRRQLRRIGITAFVHEDPGAAAVVRIDRIRRLGWPDEAPATLAITDLRVIAEPTARFTPVSVDFALSLPARNPFDPESADVVAEIESPTGKTLVYPAYWSEPFALRFKNGTENAVPVGPGAWHWRFSPPESGLWRWRVRARILWRGAWQEALSPWHESQVPAGLAAMPPVRPSSRDPLWWETEDGRFWYPLGINLRSPSDDRQDRVLAEAASGRPVGRPDADPLTGDLTGWNSARFGRLGTRAYERWLPRMHEAGMNWARVWMCPWWCGLEWAREWDEFGGLAVYNQAAAARLDRVLDLCAVNGIYVQLELQNHGMTSERVDQQWRPDSKGNPGSPYSTRNGGPCASAGEFYRSDEVWEIHAKRLRYTLARWGWCSHLGSLVLSSEMEFTGDWNESGAYQEDEGHAPATQKWIERSLAWFTANDPQRRPVTVHFSHPWRASRLWSMSGLGFSYSNAYTGFQQAMGRLGGRGSGLDRALETYLVDHFPPWRLKRPTLIGEWGGHWDVNSSATLAAELRTGLWMQAVLPYGGNTGFWWWLWLDVANDWQAYLPVARFTAGWDPRGRTWRVEHPEPANQRLKAIGMGAGDEHRCYVWRRGLDVNLDLSGSEEGGTLTVPVAAAGSVWSVERWDCDTGRVVDTTVVTADAEGTLPVPLGTIDRDVAFVLRRSDAASTPSR